MLILTACPPAATRITRATALARNRLVAALATEIHAPHIAENSPLAALLAEFSLSPERAKKAIVMLMNRGESEVFTIENIAEEDV
jgi:hypothetical protein